MPYDPAAPYGSTSLAWLRNPGERRWELSDGTRTLGYVTDQFLQRCDCPRAQIEELMARRFAVALPDEAFGGRP